SLVASPAALASVANLASRAVKSALFSQIAGNAAVSPPVLEVSGKSAGALSPASAKVANTFFAAARSKGCLASSMSVATLLWSPFAFIRALRAAIGSLCATNAVAPNANIATTSAVRIISLAPSVDRFPCRAARLGRTSRKHPDEFFYSRRGENWNPAGVPDLRITTSLQGFASDFKPKNTAESLACQHPPVPKRHEKVLPRAGGMRGWAPGQQQFRKRHRGGGGSPASPPVSSPGAPPRAARPSPPGPGGGCGRPARAHPRCRSSPPGKSRWRPPPPPPSPLADWSGTARCTSRRRAAGYRRRAAGRSPSTRR